MTSTLLAVTGLSPAIVTETIWALAKQSPPIIPKRVVFITTVTGAQALEDQLFSPREEDDGSSIWETLRKHLGVPPDHLIAEPPYVISMPDTSSGRSQLLDDIRTPAENSATAEFIFAKVWEIVRDPDQRLIASVAGGRKTMGALLHAAVSLIGRENDLVTHVLVTAPFDTLRNFYFPSQPESPLLHSSGAAYNPEDAELMLAEVPFVPLRNRFQDLDELPPSFERLRRSLSERLQQDAQRPIPITIDHKNEILRVDGHSFPIRPRALAILHFVLKCNEKDSIPPSQKTAAESFNKRIATHPEEFGAPDFGDLTEEDFRRELNFLRDTLKACSWSPSKRTLRQLPFALTVAS